MLQVVLHDHQLEIQLTCITISFWLTFPGAGVTVVLQANLQT
jgi:hypothetical protein